MEEFEQFVSALTDVEVAEMGVRLAGKHGDKPHGKMMTGALDLGLRGEARKLLVILLEIDNELITSKLN